LIVLEVVVDIEGTYRITNAMIPVARPKEIPLFLLDG
jgi:hypothetical protein